MLEVGAQTFGEVLPHDPVRVPGVLNTDPDSVPVSRLPDLVYETKEDIKQSGIVSHYSRYLFR